MRWLFIGRHAWLPATDALPTTDRPRRVFAQQSLQGRLQTRDAASAADAPAYSTDADAGDEDFLQRARACHAAYEEFGVVLTRYRGPLWLWHQQDAPAPADSPSLSIAARAERWLAAASAWFLPADFALTASVSACQGLATRHCGAAAWLALAMNGVGLLLGLCRPRSRYRCSRSCRRRPSRSLWTARCAGGSG